MNKLESQRDTRIASRDIRPSHPPYHQSAKESVLEETAASVRECTSKASFSVSQIQINLFLCYYAITCLEIGHHLINDLINFAIVTLGFD